MKRVLVTGATGCVGHYVIEALHADPDVALVLLARNPAKLKLPNLDRITWIQDDVRNVEAYADALQGLAGVVHIATAWGDPESYPINVDATLALARLTAPAPFIYFSTASILDEQNKPLEVADTEGTDYVRSKYLAYQALKASEHAGRVMTVFPTIIFGGSPHHPTSHASNGLPGLVKALWVLRWLTVDGSLHFIHAADIARVVAHLLEVPRPGADLVLGNDCATVDDLLARMCGYYALPRGRRLNLTPLTGLIGRLAGRRMNSWDRVCLEQRHFRYEAVNPRRLGLAPGLESIEQILATIDRRGVPAPQPAAVVAGG
ncbi:MAG: nucleoside-diphosphate-sugar epimerase [Cyanobacteria bacterium RYN_339]|nr:nucleoside-diphosphate-sugar epimerase [Cyanobacteria bacterium RYN_339]